MTHGTLFAPIAAAAALFAGGTVMAQMPGGDARVGGGMTRSQAQERAAAAFDRLDIDRDGQLDHADRAGHRQARFDRLDTDGDGAISRDEFAAQRKRPMRGAMSGERRGEMRAEAHGGGRMGRWGGSGEGGAIGRDDFIAQALARFDRADADGDGTVTAAERRAAREGQRRGRGAAE